MVGFALVGFVEDALAPLGRSWRHGQGSDGASRGAFVSQLRGKKPLEALIRPSQLSTREMAEREYRRALKGQHPDLVRDYEPGRSSDDKVALVQDHIPAAWLQVLDSTGSQ